MRSNDKEGGEKSNVQVVGESSAEAETGKTLPGSDDSEPPKKPYEPPKVMLVKDAKKIQAVQKKLKAQKPSNEKHK